MRAATRAARAQWQRLGEKVVAAPMRGLAAFGHVASLELSRISRLQVLPLGPYRAQGRRHHRQQWRRTQRDTCRKLVSGPWRGCGVPNACAASPLARDGARPAHSGGGAVQPGPRPGASGPAPGPASSSPRTARSGEPAGGTGPGAPGHFKEGGGPGGGGPRSGCRGDGAVTRPEGGSEKVAGAPRQVGGAVRAARRWGARAVACPRSCWPSTRCAGRRSPGSLRAGLRWGAGSRGGRQSWRGLREAR